MDKYYYFHKRYKIWMHRTPLKLFINPILRFIQFWTMKPFVIASDTDFDEKGKPHFMGYCICKAEYVKEKINEEDLINIEDF